MTISQNIAAFRKAKGYTQEQLGEILGVSNQAVSKWESGISCPDIMLLPDLAEALGVTLGDLYGISEDSRDLNQRIDAFPSEMQNTILRQLCRQMEGVWAFRELQRDPHREDHLRASRTVGVIPYTAGGAAFISDDLSVISSAHDLQNGGDIFGRDEIASGMKKLCDPHVRAVLRVMYAEAFSVTLDEQGLAAYAASASAENNLHHKAFFLADVTVSCGLSAEEALEALEKLIHLGIVTVYREMGQTKYLLEKPKAVEATVLFRAFERFMSEPVQWGCGYLIGNGILN